VRLRHLGLALGERSLALVQCAHALHDRRLGALELGLACRQRALAFVQPARGARTERLCLVELDLARSEAALPLVELGSAAIRLGADLRCGHAGSLRGLGARASDEA
jgi:hypothetical protein